MHLPSTTSVPTSSRGWPGTTFMIGIALLLTAVCWWLAAEREARVEDALGSGSDRWPDMRIDINTATAAELALLPGLGDRLAQRIVDDRAAHGRFASVVELERVPGMGPATVARLAPYADAQ